LNEPWLALACFGLLWLALACFGSLWLALAKYWDVILQEKQQKDLDKNLHPEWKELKEWLINFDAP
jgi:hypothetical protein